jgi:hypothetical protein
MQTDVAETIYERLKALPPEKQEEILHQIELFEQDTPLTIWEKIRARAGNLPDEIWEQMPVDGSEQHDHYISGSPKK